MAKFKKRKVNTAQDMSKNKVQKNCAVRLKRLRKGVCGKIENIHNKQSEEPVKALHCSTINSEDIDDKYKNCVVRLTRMAHKLQGGKSASEQKQTIQQTKDIANDAEPVLQLTMDAASPKKFRAPGKKSKLLPNDISNKRMKISQEVGTESHAGDVYEFPSESSISEQEDPTSEVVRELIRNGKVSVAKHIKGKGKLKATRKRVAPTVSRNNKKIKHNEKVQGNEMKPGNKGSPKQVLINISSSPPSVQSFESVESVESNEPAKTQQRDPVTNKRKLLEIARNIVKQSTPIRKKNSEPIGSPFSPIAIQSPWRPPEETVLPRVFYFWRNEDNLPSYSSDFIPSSQVIDKTTRSVLNNSNIENVNPDNKTSGNNNNNSNPRKTLGHRSPLKSINILDVINLTRKSAIDKEPKSFVHLLACKNSPQIINKSPRKGIQSNQNIEPLNISIDNCFGFDDCIENLDEETPKVFPDKSQLISKLKNLQRLLPKKPSRRPQDKMRAIFPKQRIQKDIRDVLTSTFQEQDSKFNSSTINFDSSVDISMIPEKENQSFLNLHLFDELEEPKPSSDSKTHLRTYIRYPKKRRHTDEEEEEEEEEKEEEVQEVQVKKRNKATKEKSDKELKKFIEEFNSICEEVDQYELHVERG